MENGRFKTTGAFMLIDPWSRAVIDEEGTPEPVLKSPFIEEKIAAGLVVEIEDKPAKPAARSKPAAAEG